MTNEEMKKKIMEVIDNSVDDWATRDKRGRIHVHIEKIADALIAAGMGDVKRHRVFVSKDGKEVKQFYNGEEVEQIVKEREEYKHRAERAERALRNAAPRLKCRGGLGKGFCRVDKCDYYHCNNDEGCVKAHLRQAEKELAEEGKE